MKKFSSVFSCFHTDFMNKYSFPVQQKISGKFPGNFPKHVFPEKLHHYWRAPLPSQNMLLISLDRPISTSGALEQSDTGRWVSGQFGADNSALDNSARQFVADNSAQRIILILEKIPLSFTNIFRDSGLYFSKISAVLFSSMSFHFGNIFNKFRFHFSNIIFSIPLPFQQ